MDTKPSLRIGLLLDNIESEYHASMIAGVQKPCRAMGARLVVIAGGWLEPMDSPPLARSFVYELVEAAGFDGLVVLAGSLSNRAGLARFQDFIRKFGGVPMVSVGIEVPGIPSVWVDNESGVRDLVAHLIEVHNRRHIVMFGGRTDSPEVAARQRGYAAALEAHGLRLDPSLIVESDLGHVEGVRAMTEQVMEKRGSFAAMDALVAANDELALGAIEVLTLRGVMVPEQVSVVGFDDLELARRANPPLSTVNQQVTTQAETAARLLLESLRSKQPMPMRTVLESRAVFRLSCGCPQGFHNDSASIMPMAGSLARSCRLALVERRALITAALARAAGGRIVGNPNWEMRLLDALGRDLTMMEEMNLVLLIERLARHQIGAGRDITACHDVLTHLRLEALTCATLEPLVRPRLEDIFQEARMVLARVGAELERARDQLLSSRMRVITKACLAVAAGAPERVLVRELEDQLPSLGIAGYTVSRVRESPRGLFDVVARRAAGMEISTISQVSGLDLGLDPVLMQTEVAVVEPLEFRGEITGLAAFGWGADNPVHYEHLRDVLSLALYSLRHRD